MKEELIFLAEAFEDYLTKNQTEVDFYGYVGDSFAYGIPIYTLGGGLYVGQYDYRGGFPIKEQGIWCVLFRGKHKTGQTVFSELIMKEYKPEFTEKLNEFLKEFEQ